MITECSHEVIKSKLISIFLCSLSKHSVLFAAKLDYSQTIRDVTKVRTDSSRYHKCMIFQLWTPGWLFNIHLNYYRFRYNITWLSKRLRKIFQNFWRSLYMFTLPHTHTYIYIYTYLTIGKFYHITIFVTLKTWWNINNWNQFHGVDV